jgi:hypothetical protein
MVGVCLWVLCQQRMIGVCEYCGRAWSLFVNTVSAGHDRCLWVLCQQGMIDVCEYCVSRSWSVSVSTVSAGHDLCLWVLCQQGMISVCKYCISRAWSLFVSTVSEWHDRCLWVLVSGPWSVVCIVTAWFWTASYVRAIFSAFWAKRFKKIAPISFTLRGRTSVALRHENRWTDFDETEYMATLPENCPYLVIFSSESNGLVAWIHKSISALVTNTTRPKLCKYPSVSRIIGIEVVRNHISTQYSFHGVWDKQNPVIALRILEHLVLFITESGLWSPTPFRLRINNYVRSKITDQCSRAL